MSGHSVRWRHEDGFIAAQVVCHEPLAGWCRTACGCTWDYALEMDSDGVIVDYNCRNGHALKAARGCQIEERYALTSDVTHEYGGDDGTPVHDGLIVVHADDYGFWWKYADEVAG